MSGPAILVCQLRLADLIWFTLFAMIGFGLGYLVNKLSGQSFNAFKIVVCFCFGFVGFSIFQFINPMCGPLAQERIVND